MGGMAVAVLVMMVSPMVVPPVRVGGRRGRPVPRR